MTTTTTVTTFRKTFQIPANAEGTFDAIIDPAHLEKWFAEHVEVEPRAGGKYRFWGRHTPWVAREQEADQTIVQIDPPRLLSFTWTWRGCRGEVTLELHQIKPGTTQLAVHHTCAGELWPAACDAESLMGDFWKLFAGNLRSYLRSGQPAIRPDHSRTRGEVKLSIEIDAPPRDVFRALSDPEQMNRWLARQARVDPRPGGEYAYGWTTTRSDGSSVPAGPARILEFVPDRLLVHDWHYGDEPPTRVRWELEAIAADKTRVTITHTKFDDETMHGGYTQGWAAFLVALRELSEEMRSEPQIKAGSRR
jgi:uncharacterized protein YndB with AHSA1/START domain